MKDRTETRDVRRRLIQTGYALLLQAMANTQKDIDDAQIARLMTAGDLAQARRAAESFEQSLLSDDE